MDAATDTPDGGSRVPAVGTTVVELRGISRSYGGVRALRGVDLTLRARRGAGAPGRERRRQVDAGQVLTGVISADEGEILVDGELTEFRNSREARSSASPPPTRSRWFPDADVAENIFAGRLPTERGAIRWRELHAAASRTLDELGVELDPHTPVSHLGIADRQLIEIGKSLSTGARVLILDEPTAVLSSREIDRLFGIVRTLRDRGVALMFISHKLEEIREITDRVVVMRDGQQVAERDSGDVPVRELIRLMVGREISDLYPARATDPGEVMLEAKGLSRDGFFEDISFTVRAGEIVGFAGLVGAGGPRSRSRSSASIRSTAARSCSRDSRFGLGRRDMRSAAASPTCRRTVSSTGWCRR